jgi:hypothetical protein
MPQLRNLTRLLAILIVLIIAPVAAQEGGSMIRQWAADATATSEFSPNGWSAMQATGAPDTTECGDFDTAWASLASNTVETLTLTYETPVFPTRVDIYQTYNPGSITSIELIPADGSEPIVVPDSADPGTDCPGVFRLTIDMDDLPAINGIAITVDQREIGNWNEIDAVMLIGFDASEATAEDAATGDQEETVETETPEVASDDSDAAEEEDPVPDVADEDMDEEAAEALEMDSDEIEAIAQHVVLIIALQNGEPVSSGSGTIVSSDGLIYTNRHVTDVGDDYAIYVLDDINEQPELAYFATISSEFNSMDFATLQINRNSDGEALLRTNIDIPFLDVSEPASLQRGDRLFVLGYPGIGEDFLVLTDGLISSIQNGQIGDERMPIWYGTNAEIAPGNSGGLAVTVDGTPVGIPTAVSSEERTGGRLGMILPFNAIFSMIEAGDRVVMENGGDTPEQQPPSNEPSGLTVTCDNGVEFNNGVEVTVVQMRTGFTYRATAIGLNGFDPVLAVLDDTGTGLCTDDSNEAAAYSANLPTTGQVNTASTNSQVQFSNNGGSAFADISLVVGGYNNQSGEFLLILEGMALTSADGLGDPFAVRVSPGMVASGVPLTAYMISDTSRFDPALALIDTEANFLTDVDGIPIVCDDAGNASLCYGNSVPLTNSYVSANGGRRLPGFDLDSMLSLNLPSELIGSSLFFMASNSAGVINGGTNTFGDYTMVFHIGIG